MQENSSAKCVTFSHPFWRIFLQGPRLSPRCVALSFNTARRCYYLHHVLMTQRNIRNVINPWQDFYVGIFSPLTQIQNTDDYGCMFWSSIPTAFFTEKAWMKNKGEVRPAAKKCWWSGFHILPNDSYGLKKYDDFKISRNLKSVVLLQKN